MCFALLKPFLGLDIDIKSVLNRNPFSSIYKFFNWLVASSFVADYSCIYIDIINSKTTVLFAIYLCVDVFWIN